MQSLRFKIQSTSIPVIRHIPIVCLLFIVGAFSLACGDSSSSSNGNGNTGGNNGGGSTTPSEVLYALTTDSQSTNSAFSIFTINPSGALTPVGTPLQFPSPSNFAGVQAAPHASGKFIFATSGDSILTYRVAPNGSLTQVGSVTAPSLGFQILPEPSGHFLYANRGAGVNAAIVTYSIDQNTGALAQVGQPAPHSLGLLAMDPKGRFLYVIDIGSIQALTINTTTGALTPAATTTGLNDDISDVSADGKFLYTGPGHPRDNGFEWTGFLIDPATGALTSNGQTTALGNGGTTFDPTGRFLFVNDVTGIRAFSIDGTTGKLTEITGSPFPRGTVGSSNPTDLLRLTVNRSGKFLFVTDGQKLATFGIGTDGSLAEVTGSPVTLTGVPSGSVSLFTVQPSAP